MASELHVYAIKHSGGTSAITINSSGNVSIPGSVVQVQRTYVADASVGSYQVSSTSLSASGIQCSITPKFSNSLILVDFSSSMTNSGSNEAMKGRMYLKIGSASISAMSGADQYHLGYTEQSSNRYAPFCFSGSYTATSTDTLMFEPYIQQINANSAVQLLHQGASARLTLMEIAQ